MSNVNTPTNKRNSINYSLYGRECVCVFVEPNWESCGLSLKYELDVMMVMFTELKINIWMGVIERNNRQSSGNTKKSHGSYEPTHTH